MFLEKLLKGIRCPLGEYRRVTSFVSLDASQHSLIVCRDDEVRIAPIRDNIGPILAPMAISTTYLVIIIVRVFTTLNLDKTPTRTILD